MSVEEMMSLNWVLALAVAGLSTSWLILVMQAFFHDKRIGFACVFGGAGAAFAMAISETLSHALLAALTVVNLALIGIFVVSHCRRPLVYLPATLLILSLAAGYWVWMKLTKAGFLAAL